MHELKISGTITGESSVRGKDEDFKLNVQFALPDTLVVSFNCKKVFKKFKKFLPLD